MGPEPDDVLLNTEDAAKLMGVTPSTIQRWVREGRITAYRPHNRYTRFSRNELLAYVRSGDSESSDST